MIWQLLQVQKLHNTPLVLVGDMYSDLVKWFEAWMLSPDFPLAGADDLAIPQCVSDGPAAVEIIREHYDSWVTN